MQTSFRRTLAFGLVSALTATAVHAAYAPPEPVKADDTIVVTGKRYSKEELRRVTAAFVRTATAAPELGQFARRIDPICPAVLGLDAQYATLVTAKIRRIVEAVGAKLADEKCRANLLVSFTGDADRYIAGIGNTRPQWLRGLRHDERLALENAGTAVRWWYRTAPRATDGLSNSQTNTGSVDSRLGGVIARPTSDDSIGTATTSSSLIDTHLAVNLTSSIVVVDIGKATGYPLESVAAYAAMVSLARVRINVDYRAYPSILAMFGNASDQAPRDLTEWDYAYLRALYRISLNRVAQMQRAKIRGEMVKALSE